MLFLLHGFLILRRDFSRPRLFKRSLGRILGWNRSTQWSLEVEIGSQRHLSTLIVITDADSALTRETLGPEATNVNVGLWDAGVGEQEPGTENWLSEDVKNSVGNDLLVDVHVAAAVGNTPDARIG